MVRFSCTSKSLGSARLNGKVSFNLLAPDLGQEVALAPAKAGVVEGARVRALPPLELVKVKLALERRELGVYVDKVREGRDQEGVETVNQRCQ